MAKITNWKSKYATKVLDSRGVVKLSGVTNKPGKDYMGLFLVFIGVCFGLFIGTMILRPDLINWNTFFRSFMIGIIIAR